MNDGFETRDRVLEVTLETPHSKPALVEALGVSRSTVDRTVATLLEGGCLERHGSTYRATEKGRLSAKARRRYLEELESIDRAGPILSVLPHETIPLSVLRTAAIDLPTEEAPWTAFEPSTALITSCSRLFGTGPVIYEQFFEDFQTSIEQGGFAAELVLDTDLVASMDAANRDRLEAVLEPGGGTVYTTNLTDPYAIWIAERTDGDPAVAAGITVYDEGGVVGVVRTTEPSGVAWAREAYHERRSEASLYADY